MQDYAVTGDFFQSVEVLVDDVAITSGFELAVIRAGERPIGEGAWNDPLVLRDGPGFMTGDLAEGFWQVWARLTDVDPETPIIYLGTFRLY